MFFLGRGLGVTEAGLEPLRARRLAESSTVVESMMMLPSRRVGVPGMGLGRMKMPLATCRQKNV